ncbi:M12 family metallopeptidase [Pseudochelatococcus sp. B33]
MSDNENRFCVCLTLGDLPETDRQRLAGHKAALLNSARWEPGDVISVRFLEGSEALRERVIAAASEWTKHANLTLDFRDQGPTAIRIAFQQGRGSWSYLGTMCLQIPEPQPTMNYGWLTDSSDEDELRRVVLHEFGHALGLIHEHQNPEGGIRWNRDAVVRDLSGPPNNWNDATIENNIFKKYEPDEVLASDVDPLSIMLYPIPKAWTEEGYFSAALNKELSENDKLFALKNYPR